MNELMLTRLCAALDAISTQLSTVSIFLAGRFVYFKKETKTGVWMCWILE